MSIQLLALSCDTCGSRFQLPVENLFYDNPSQVSNPLGRSVVLHYCPPCHPYNPQTLPDDYRTYGAGIIEKLCLCDRSMHRDEAASEASRRNRGKSPAVCEPRHNPVVPEACEFYTQIYPNLTRVTRMAATRDELLFVRREVNETLFSVRTPCCNKTVRVTIVGLNELVDHGSAGLLGPVVDGERCLLVVYGCSTCKTFHPVPEEEYASLLRMGVQIPKRSTYHEIPVVVQRRVAFEGKGPSDHVLFVEPAREGPLRFGVVGPAPSGFAFGRAPPAPTTPTFGTPLRADAPTPASVFGKPPAFGAPVADKPAFAFPTAVPCETKPAMVKAAFSFASKPEVVPEAPVQKSAEPAPGGFAFGRAPAAPVQEPKPAAFSFGAPPSAEVKPVTEVRPPMFGSAAASEQKPYAFSFAPKPAAPKVETSAEEKQFEEDRKLVSGFSFGATPAPPKEEVKPSIPTKVFGAPAPTPAFSGLPCFGTPDTKKDVEPTVPKYYFGSLPSSSASPSGAPDAMKE